eukprot:GHVN01057722.1.p1 GENE.GHVN01057722.1~~GHVN01057722.1.p1  ORF type:complete len:1302 (+),score=187.31 GHVN01057722.1:75-3980(+)
MSHGEKAIDLGEPDKPDEAKSGCCGSLKGMMGSGEDDSDLNGEEKPRGSFFGPFHWAKGLDIFLVVLGATLFILNGTLLPLFILIFGDMVNIIGGANPADDLDKYTLILVYLGIAAFTVGFIGTTSFEYSAECQISRFRAVFVDSIMRQEMAYFDAHDTGTFSTKLNQCAIRIREGIGLKIGQVFMFLSLFVSGYVVGFIKGWELTLVVSAALPLIAMAGAYMMIAIANSGRLGQQVYAAAGSVAEETLSAMRTVAAFGLEASRYEAYSNELKRATGPSRKSTIAESMGLASVMGIIFLSYALGFWYSGILVANDLIDNCQIDCFDAGSALTVFFAVLMSCFAVGQAVPPLNCYFKAMSSSSIALSLIGRESLIDPYSTDGITDKEIRGSIVFDKVRFAYPIRPDFMVFQELCFEIEAGQTIALVGASGCGKSTAVQLIERFYDIDGGLITVDGRPITEWNINHLRGSMALVSQEPRLFSRSIRENIRMGRVEATDEEVVDAAKAANAHRFISNFPDGYDTFVGEGGSQLSGGQKQRIAIARAIVRNPQILLLDEATSALDNESEKIVQSALDALIGQRRRTTVVIAHRLSTIKKADKIIVLDNSKGDGAKVVEVGTHRELLKIEDGLYRNLAVAQFGDDPDVQEEVKKSDTRASRDMSNLLRSYSIIPPRAANEKTYETKTSCFCIKKQVEVDPDAKPPVGFKEMVSLMAPHWPWLVVGCIAAALAGSVFPLFAVIFSEFLGIYFSPDPDFIKDESSFWALMFVVLAVGVFTANLIQSVCFGFTGLKVIEKLRKDLFQSCIHQEIKFFDSPKNSPGNLSNVMSSDVLLVKGMVGDNTAIMVQAVSSVLTGLIIAFIASPELAAVTLCAFAAIVPASLMEMQFMSGSSQAVDNSPDSPAQLLNEIVMNVRAIAAYGLQPTMNEYYDEALSKSFSKARRSAVVVGFFYGLSQILQYCANALALWYGGKLVEEGKLQAPDMFRCVFALLMAAMGFGQSAVFMTDTKKATEAAKNVFWLANKQSEIDPRSPDGIHKGEQKLSASVEFTDVKFRYPERKDVPVFSTVSFVVDAGTTVALVGSSGCGKSTCVQLLERFYDLDGTDGGSVAFAGEQIDSYNLKYLRSQIGLVSQEPVLFTDTVKENIRQGDRSATDEQIVQAASMANAHDFISDFPEGYNTNVGKGGCRLSGGQKQRVALARAILRDPKLLLLDEATSALDSESERLVQEALDSLLAKKNGRTTLVIAHRLSTVRNADKIVVFKNEDLAKGSEIVEMGTHDELMAIEKGTYRKLVNISQANQQATLK